MPRGQRSVQECLLSPWECQRLIFIHKSICTAGYSPHLWTSKLGDVAYAAPEFLLPMICARDKVLAAAEAALRYELEFCVEFTGLVSWTTGAAIQWHHDSNRPHLKQRVATAVVYLNDASEFEGGQLQFESGALRHVDAAVGSMVTFMADEANVHRVTPVTSGERITLTLWFTLHPEHCEDNVILRLLKSDAWQAKGQLPPDSLYLDCGTDIRLTRLAAVGLKWMPLQLHNAGQKSCPRDSCAASEKPAVASEGNPEQQECSLGRIRCQQLASIDRSKCSCCGVGKLMTSLSKALLEVAWLQWQDYSNQSIAYCPCSQASASENGLHQHMTALALLLPRAIEDWHSSGKLYDVSLEDTPGRVNF